MIALSQSSDRPRAPAAARARRWAALPALILLLALAPTPRARDGVIAPALRQVLAAAAPGEQVPAYLVLADQLSPRALEPATRGLAPRAQRQVVAERLKAHAAATQGPVRSALDAAVADGRASDVRVLWIGNALLFQAEPAVIEALATLPGVDRIRPIVHPDPEQTQDDGDAALQPGVGSYPFYDDFESGSLLPHWTVSATGAGYVSVTSAELPLGDYHVIMASAVDGTDSTASITVQLDLTGQTDVGIRFKHKEFGDEDDPEDGVFVSADGGTTWFEVISLQGPDASGPSYETRFVTLDPLLPGFGIDFTSTFQVRFQWRDNFNIPADGFAFDEIEIGPGVGVEPPAGPEQNLIKLQAPMLWERGFTGSGQLIGNIDSGTWWTHPDLVDHTWANPGEIPGNGLDDDGNGFIDDIQGWDFFGNDNDVISSDPHGTETAGLMVGDGTQGKITGMAPGGTLVICRISGETDYWQAQQYLLDVGVDVISSSHSFKWDATPDYPMHRQICDMELAAGIIHANSIGNQGQLTLSFPVPFNIATPGNVPSPFAHPDLEPGGRSSIMACGGILLDGDQFYLPSGRGPSAWEDLTLYDPAYPFPQDPAYWDYPYGGFDGTLPGLIKPDVVTYTAPVKTTYPPGIPAGSAYADFDGTSAATPQLGGALLLLRQVQPLAEPRHLDAALELTAVDLGPPGKDSQYGAGKIQVFDAARRLQLLVRATPHTVPIGGALDLQVFGNPGALVFGFTGLQLQDATGDFNLALPFISLSPVPLDPSGQLDLSVTVPNDPVIVGLSLWFQFGAANWDPATWGPGPFLSVPEDVIFTP